MEVNQQQVDTSIKEGGMTRAIENQTAKLQSVHFLGLAVASMALSATLSAVFGKKQTGNFVGLWAPTILVLGLYNKIVKLEAELERRRLH